jgi:hypothetical protein
MVEHLLSIRETLGFIPNTVGKKKKKRKKEKKEVPCLVFIHLIPVSAQECTVDKR